MSQVVLHHLEPIVAAELSRGNHHVGGWLVVTEHGADRWQMEFLNPLDTDAILAEFTLSEGVWARDHRVGSTYGEAAMSSPYRLSRAQRRRNAQWWEDWNADPQLRMQLPSPQIDRLTVPRRAR